MAVRLNKAGERKAMSLIRAGKYEMTKKWSFDAADGDTLLGEKGDDWTAYAAMHLGEDTAASADTRERWKYPFGKDGTVYRRALGAIRSRSKQQGLDDIFDAAGRLMEAMDEEEGKSDGSDDDGRAGAAALAARAEDPEEAAEGDEAESERAEEAEDAEDDTDDTDGDDGDVGDGEDDDEAEEAAAEEEDEQDEGETDAEDEDEEGEMGARPRPRRAAPRAPGGLTRRKALMSHATFDPSQRTVDMDISAGSPVRRYDWDAHRDYDEVLSIHPDAIRMGRLNAGAPLIDSHDYYGGTRAILGAVVPGSARVEKGRLRATAKFSRSPEGERAFQDAQDGILRHVSVGYVTHKHEVDETTSPPTYRATDWEPYEVSAVQMPADPKAGFRAAFHQGTARNPRGTMTIQKPAARPAADPDAIRAQILADNKTVRDIGMRLGLPDDFVAGHVAAGTKVSTFRRVAIDKRAELDQAHEIDGSRTTAPGQSPAAPFVSRRLKPVEMKKGQMASRLVRLYGAAKGNPDHALRLAKHHDWDDGNRELVVRALTAGIGAGGGFLIPEEYASEVIELLRNRAVVRKLGATQIPMPGGNLTMPRLQGGATATYVGEATATNASQENIGQVRFTEKKLMALVPVSNDLLKFASPQADEVVLNDMIAQMAVAEDAAFIRGGGTAFSPRGIRYWAQASNVLVSNGTTLAEVTQDLQDMLDALEQNNVRMIRPGWIFNPRSANYIMLLQATTGQFVYRDEMAAGKLLGHPFEKTNNIPANLGGGAQTEAYLVDFADAVIADVPGIEIEVSREAAYVDSTGTMQAAFSQDVTVIRTVERHDFALRHDVSAAVNTAVAY